MIRTGFHWVVALVVALSFLSIFPAAPTSAATGDGQPGDANIQYFGRWDKSDLTNAKSYWAGAYFRVNFTGTTLSIKLAATTGMYVTIDNGAVVQYDNVSGTVNLTPTPLSSGTHTLLVSARAEVDNIQFQGLVLGSGATTQAPTVRNRLIEFVGDSITAGCCALPHYVQDNYAWLTGESLNADHTQIAYSGVCLQDPSCGSGVGMSVQYFKLQSPNFPSSPMWDFNRYQADQVVINLGTNDNTAGISDATFQSTYTTFLQNIRTKYPKAEIFVLRTFGGYKVAPTIAAVAARRNAGDAKVFYVDTNGWVTTGTSDYSDALHPSASGHIKIANRLTKVLTSDHYGKIGGKLDFNGTNSYATLGFGGNANATNMGTDSFSVGLWFKSVSPVGHLRMITKGNWGNSSGYFMWYDGGAITFSIGSNGVQANTVLVSTPGGLDDGNWHQATAVVDRTAQTVKIYIDGVAKTLTKGGGYCGTASGASLDISGCTSLNASSSDALTFGSYNGFAEFYSGSLDDVRLYKRALSAAEITEIYSFNGLVGQWKFDEGNGTVFADSSGHTSAGTSTDADWVAGKFGKALSFNGQSSYDVMSRSGGLNMGEHSFSVAAWFKSDSTGTHQRILSKGDWGSASGYFLWYEGGALTFSLGGEGTNASTALVGTPGGFGDGNWHHVAAVVDRSARTIQIYVDGTAKTLTSATGYCGAASGNTLNIAGCTSLNGSSTDPFTLSGHLGTYELFNGALDDVRVYNRALSQTDINQILLGN
ncbi:LamG-like jellyroll fold domain-containing protein [Cohnella silvisoli]|uniref:GDSL-type esterase/lipase family protein n=1 Tax=Cohnella silvisoli TaxID=2873699 RepID=A0ABV1KLL1_9BACL|nr:LamG-like jellyroll fold domain-containing protein [Cohnella silvisoli]MCD9020665.1 hypothetical protein [Cohnella silvisoli]